LIADDHVCGRSKLMPVRGAVATSASSNGDVSRFPQPPAEGEATAIGGAGGDPWSRVPSPHRLIRSPSVDRLILQQLGGLRLVALAHLQRPANQARFELAEASSSAMAMAVAGTGAAVARRSGRAATPDGGTAGGAPPARNRIEAATQPTRTVPQLQVCAMPFAGVFQLAHVARPA
jgi:hypothetical protein